jgi:exosome complex component RRP42
LDATTQEEAAAPVRLLLIYSFSAKSPAMLHGMHLLGAGDVDLARIETLLKVRDAFLSNAPHLHHPQEGEKYALEIYTALNAKLKDEDLRRTDKARLKFSFSSVR